MIVDSDDVDRVEDDDEQAHHEEDGSTFLHVRMVGLKVQCAEQVQDAPPHQAEERVLERIAGANNSERILWSKFPVPQVEFPSTECFEEGNAEAEESHEHRERSQLLWIFAKYRERYHTAECVEESNCYLPTVHSFN